MVHSRFIGIFHGKLKIINKLEKSLREKKAKNNNINLTEKYFEELLPKPLQGNFLGL
jgi:hypothetical protein